MLAWRARMSAGRVTVAGSRTVARGTFEERP